MGRGCGCKAKVYILQSGDQNRRSDQRPQPCLARDIGSRRGSVRAPAAGRGAGCWDTRVHKGRSAHVVDPGGGIDVVQTERLGFVHCLVCKDGHRVRQAGITCRQAARRQWCTQGEIVDIAVGWGGGVSDGVGEAVIVVMLLRIRIAWG